MMWLEGKPIVLQRPCWQEETWAEGPAYPMDRWVGAVCAAVCAQATEAGDGPRPPALLGLCDGAAGVRVR